jgi:hypothetical protein
MIDNQQQRKPMDEVLTVQNASMRLSVHPRNGGKVSEVFVTSLGRSLLALALTRDAVGNSSFATINL